MRNQFTGLWNVMGPDTLLIRRVLGLRSISHVHQPETLEKKARAMPSMALPASAALLASTPKFQISLSECQLTSGRCQIYPKCSRKVKMAQMSEPQKLKVHLGIMRDRLWEVVPHSVKEFPWKKAENVLLERLLFLGQKALKRSLVTLLIFSSLSDIVFSISTDQELMIPFGLLVGHLITYFMRDTLQEFFRESEEMGSQRQLLTISCFFVLVKFISAYFSIKARIFLSHVANGGFMQVLWFWRYLVEENGKRNEGNSISNQDASSAIDNKSSVSGKSEVSAEQVMG